MNISIDQNSNSLWDTIPKLHALIAQNLPIIHYVEDIDVAFTRVGSKKQSDNRPSLTPEQYYRNGNLDWGASLFYMSFLGRCPVNLRDLEKYTGKSTAAMARALDLTEDLLYSTYAVGDNQQLTGPSYLEPTHKAHRLLGDITRAEFEAPLQELLIHAETDLLNSFPEPEVQHRIKTWFNTESKLVDQLLDNNNYTSLGDLYQDWMNHHLPNNPSKKTSELLSSQSKAGEITFKLLQKITARYHLFVELYNTSIEETNLELTPINLKSGDLPFFAIYNHDGHLVRSPLRLNEESIEAGFMNWKVSESYQTFSSNENMTCLTGKALLLVILVRLRGIDNDLVLPYNGSLYTPAANKLVEKLIAHEFIDRPARSIKRVKLNFIHNWHGLDTTIKLPKYLQRTFGQQITADEFSRIFEEKMEAASAELTMCLDKASRKTWSEQQFPALFQKITELEELRKNYGQDPEKRHLCHQLWSELKPLQKQLNKQIFEQIIENNHICNLDYWNSRGALLPWSVALGGEDFYQNLVQQAEIYHE